MADPPTTCSTSPKGDRMRSKAIEPTTRRLIPWLLSRKAYGPILLPRGGALAIHPCAGRHDRLPHPPPPLPAQLQRTSGMGSDDHRGPWLAEGSPRLRARPCARSLPVPLDAIPSFRWDTPPTVL